MKPTSFDRPTLSYEDVAAQLGCSRSAVEKLVKLGQLPAIKVSARCVRFDPTVLREFLDRRRELTAAAR